MFSRLKQVVFLSVHIPEPLAYQCLTLKTEVRGGRNQGLAFRMWRLISEQGHK